MTGRPLHVWRVTVTAYPPRSHWSQPDWDRDWAPGGWEPLAEWSRLDDDPAAFSWPGRRHYLSADAADDRAVLLRSWGAVVQVERSERVVWS